MGGEDRGFVAGLGVALGGGAVVVGLFWALFAAADSAKKSTTTTVTQTVTAAAPPTAPQTVTVSAGVAPEVVSGAYDYVRFACGACHGWKGEGGPSPAVPALTGAGKEFTTAQLRDIINKGAGISADPKAPFMPVWGSVISDEQVANLVAYIQAGLPAVPGAVPLTVPTSSSDAAAGAVLYQKFGCIDCHGPNGLGGVPDPTNPEKVIPSLTGADFRAEFKPADIAQIIRDGSVLGKGPITAMPHWGGILTDQDIAQLVEFIGTLK